MTISGELLRLCRKKRKMKTCELAEKAGVTKQMISNYEHGRNDMRISTFLKLLNAMDYDIDIVDLREGQ